MGHSIKLDDVYYDKDNEVSRQQIVVEYMKAVDALTINEEYRLKKKIVEYEDEIKDVPKVEQLQFQLANKIVGQDAIKKQLEILQIEKQNENQAIEQIQEKDKELQSVKDRMINIENILVSIQPLLQQIKPEMLSKMLLVERKK
jgi:hypothetical protein